MQRSIYLCPGDWIVPDLYHTRYEAVSAADCDHAPKNCLDSPSRQINPSIERAEVRCGSLRSDRGDVRRGPSHSPGPCNSTVSRSIALATSRHCAIQLRGKRKVRSAPSMRRSLRHIPGA